jgi:diacylglycerol kinase (ATP)
MSKTLIILNPHAASGRAGKLWTQVEPILWDKLGELAIVITHHPEEVAVHLERAYISGLNRVISIGGDGTNHALVNALAALSAKYPDGEPIIYGMLPIGTGRDWARSQGMPLGDSLNDIEQAADWIANAEPHPTDIGLLRFGRLQDDAPHTEHFLNIASTGLSGEVDQRVNAVQTRRPWTFLSATVQSIVRYQPKPLQVWLDDEEWYEGRALLLAVANGTTFGHGMRIAPNAATDDGLFDVVLVKDASKLETLLALRRVYDGSHLTHRAVQYRRARRVMIESEQPVSLDLDGEYGKGQRLDFQVRPGLLQLLR